VFETLTIRENYRRVVFVSESPLSQRDAELYGFTTFLRAGISVEVWDVTDIYLPGARNQHTDVIPEVKTIGFSNEADLIRNIKTLQRDDVVFCFSGDATHQLWSHRRLLRGVSKSPALFVGLSVWHLPAVHNQMVATLRKRLKEVHFTSSDLKRILKGFIFRIGNTRIGERAIRWCVRVAGIGAFDHIWAGTQVSEISFSLRSDPSKITFIHSLDYDQFRNVRQSEPTHPFICLIAGTGGLGGDSTMWIPDPSQLEAFTREYFSRLNEVLAAVEVRFGVPVVIAAHPRVSPRLYDPWVEGRRVVHGQTIKLIAQSSMVLSEGSNITAIATLTRKPLFLVYLGDFAEIVNVPIRYKDYIDAFESMLGCATLDWTKQHWNDKLQTTSTEINIARYDQYVSRLMKLPNTPDQPFWEIVLDTALTQKS